MADLYIPNSIALRNFDSIFKNNTFQFEDGKVNLSFHPNYVAMHPIGLAFYAAMGDYFIHNSVEREASINYNIRSIPYLQRMGLFAVLGFRDPIKTKEHEETGRFIPLKKIYNGEDLDNFIKTIDPILHTTRENSRVIKHVFSELLRNVIEHSLSPLGGNVCATYNRKKKKFSIGISDIGIGIYNSMRHNHPIKNHKEALIRALTPGFSGKTKRIGGTSENAGLGLFFTKCIAQSTKNHMLIYSGDSYYKLCLPKPNENLSFNADPLKDNARIKEGLPFFSGTLIGIDINIEDNESFDILMSNIGSVYRLSIRQTQRNYYKRIKFT